MNPLCGSVATLAVAAIYYLWRAYFQMTLGRERILRQRVAYMLWIMAGVDVNDCGDPGPGRGAGELDPDHDLTLAT